MFCSLSNSALRQTHHTFVVHCCALCQAGMVDIFATPGIIRFGPKVFLDNRQACCRYMYALHTSWCCVGALSKKGESRTLSKRWTPFKLLVLLRALGILQFQPIQPEMGFRHIGPYRKCFEYCVMWHTIWTLCSFW